MTCELKKILFVVGILIVLILGIIIVRNKNSSTGTAGGKNITGQQAKKSSGVMGFSPSRMSARIGQPAEFSVFINAGGKVVNGADAIISYDPEAITVLEIKPSGFFKTFPLKKINPQNGTVKVMGYDVSNSGPLNSDAPFFNLRISARKSGSYRMDISFKKGRTNLSTLVEKDTSKNLLEEVVPLNISVE